MQKPRVKVMLVFGTRPEAIKMAPLVKKYQQYPEEFETIVTITAQHREMLDQVLNLFLIKPDYDLNIMRPGQTLNELTSRVLANLDPILKVTRPDLVLVHGDTTTTFAASLAAFYHQIPVGHVEAGLRTYDKYNPYPEEMNRQLTGVMADYHFAPTQTAKYNLLKENHLAERIFVTGNTVIDALLGTVRSDYHFANDVLAKIDFASKRTILLTAHRRENLGEPLKNICFAVKEIVEKHPDVQVIFPVHLNPKVQEIVHSILEDEKSIYLIDPLDYEPFVNLIARSEIILTDSGGIQEEAPGLGKPVLVMRKTTERPEAVEAGTVKLVGIEKNEIVHWTEKLLTDREFYLQMANAVNPYGDGQASKRIVRITRKVFGFIKDYPEEYKTEKYE